MFRGRAKAFFVCIDACCVVALAGVYVYTYYDYLHTMTKNGGISMSDPQNPEATPAATSSTLITAN